VLNRLYSWEKGRGVMRVWSYRRNDSEFHYTASSSYRNGSLSYNYWVLGGFVSNLLQSIAVSFKKKHIEKCVISAYRENYLYRMAKTTIVCWWCISTSVDIVIVDECYAVLKNCHECPLFKKVLSSQILS